MQVVKYIGTGCNATLQDIARPLDAAAKSSTLGAQLTSEIDSELSRAEDALGRLPWWAAWAPASWSSSEAARPRAYLKFLRTEAPTLRALAEMAYDLQDILLGIQVSCQKYAPNTVRPVAASLSILLIWYRCP
jgi:hypothetical protein